jgi:hypothetical protein
MVGRMPGVVKRGHKKAETFRQDGEWVAGYRIGQHGPAPVLRAEKRRARIRLQSRSQTRWTYSTTQTKEKSVVVQFETEECFVAGVHNVNGRAQMP